MTDSGNSWSDMTSKRAVQLTMLRQFADLLSLLGLLYTVFNIRVLLALRTFWFLTPLKVKSWHRNDELRMKTAIHTLSQCVIIQQLLNKPKHARK